MDQYQKIEKVREPSIWHEFDGRFDGLIHVAEARGNSRIWDLVVLPSESIVAWSFIHSEPTPFCHLKIDASCQPQFKLREGCIWIPWNYYELDGADPFQIRASTPPCRTAHKCHLPFLARFGSGNPNSVNIESFSGSLR